MGSKVTLIHELGKPGRRGSSMPAAQDTSVVYTKNLIPQKFRRAKPAELPEVAELDAVRHFTRLSQKNYSIDGQFYPLGSCTMKYNPKINDQVASLRGFVSLHPLQSDRDCQGTLRIM